MDYDVILSFNTADQYFLDAYGAKVFPISYWRYHNFKKQNSNNQKPILLILPTFGADISCANNLTKSSIEEIKKHFYIIIKAHHATHFGFDGDKTIELLKTSADEYYDSDTSIDTLLKRADLVLSDNSGAIFESICADTPVALYAKDLNSRHFHTIDTPQYTLASQGILPHVTEANQILPMLLNIKPYFKKQQQLKKQLFLKPSNNPYKEFVDVINHYLSLDETKDYHKVLHDALVQEWRDNKQIISDQKNEIVKLNQTIQDLYNSTSWKVTKPLRAIKTIRKKHV